MSDGYHIEDEVLRRSYDARIMRRLLGYVRPYRRWIGTATVLLLCAAVLSNLNPVLIMRSVDYFIDNPARTSLQQDGAHANPDQLAQQIQADKQGLFLLILLLAALLFGEVSTRYAQLLIVSYVGQKTLLKMRMEIFEHLQEMSLRFLDKNPVGRLMTRVTNDVEKIQQTIVTGFVQVISDLVTLMVVLLFMFAIDWRLALTALAPVPFVTAVSLIFRKYAHRSFLEIRKKIARLNAFMQENVGGMRLIQIFGQEEPHFREYDKRNAEHRDEWLRQVRQFAIYFPSVEFLGTVSTALIVLYCGMRMLRLDMTDAQRIITGHASYGTIFAFVFLAERFFGPIRSLADRYNLLLEAMASSERVFELLDTPPDIVDTNEAQSCESLRGQVEFDHVWFAYDEAKDGGEPPWILKDISLSIAPENVLPSSATPARARAP